MELPIRFPDPFDEAARRCRAFQRLSPDERLRQLLQAIEAGFVLAQQSPHPEIGKRLVQEREAEWRRIQKELFRRHGV